MNQKILLVLTRSPYPAIDGTRERILGEIKNLKNDFQINLLIISDEKINLETKKYLENIIEGEVFIFKISKIRSYFYSLIALFSSQPLQTAYFKQPDAAKWLENNFSKYQTIHFHTIRFGEYLKKIKKRNIEKKVKLLLCYNDAISLNYQDAEKKAKGIWRFIYFLESNRVKKYEIKMAKLADGLSIVSARDSEYIKNNWAIKYPDLPIPKINIIRHGIDDNLFNYFYQPETENLVFIGNLLYPPNRQGLDFFCKNVWPKILEEKNQTKLLIIGRGGKDFFSNIKNVETLGFVDNPYPLMTKQALFVSPADFGAGVPTKSLLAMALGIPVISTANNAAGIEGIKDEENICLINYKYPPEAAKKIISLIDNKQKRISIGSSGKDLTSKEYRESINYPELKKFIQQ